MGRYTVKFTARADRNLQYWQKHGDKSILRKIEKIFDELLNILPVGEEKQNGLKVIYQVIGQGE